MLSHKERVLRTLRRESVDYSPSNLEFSAPLATRIAQALHVPVADLPRTFDNHLVYGYFHDEVLSSEKNAIRRHYRLIWCPAMLGKSGTGT